MNIVRYIVSRNMLISLVINAANGANDVVGILAEGDGALSAVVVTVEDKPDVSERTFHLRQAAHECIRRLGPELGFGVNAVFRGGLFQFRQQCSRSAFPE